MGETRKTFSDLSRSEGIQLLIRRAHSLSGAMMSAPSQNQHDPELPGKDFRFHFFSQLVGRPVCVGKIDKRIGKLTDLVFRLSEPYPEAVGLYRTWLGPADRIHSLQSRRQDRPGRHLRAALRNGRAISAVRRPNGLDHARRALDGQNDPRHGRPAD